MLGWPGGVIWFVLQAPPEAVLLPGACGVAGEDESHCEGDQASSSGDKGLFVSPRGSSAQWGVGISGAKGSPWKEQCSVQALVASGTSFAIF